MNPAGIVAEGLSVELGGRRILHDLDVAFAPGLMHGILGPNGSGKTTLVRALCGAIPARTGRVLLDGVDVASLSPARLAKHVAVVWQGGHVSGDLTVRRLVSHGRYTHLPWWRLSPGDDDATVTAAMQQAGVAGMADRLVATLSGGERQRVWLATALAQEPSLLILDEPTTYLDIAYQLDVMTLVRDLNVEHGLTVISVLHDLTQAARSCDHCIVLRDGRLQADGIPADALNADRLAADFDVDAWVTRDRAADLPVIAARHRRAKEPA